MYGSLWSSRFRSDSVIKAAQREWGTALYEFSPDDIGNAFGKLRREFPRPPSMTEFLNCCREYRKLRIEKEGYNENQIEAQPSSQETVDKYLDKMKIKVGKNKEGKVMFANNKRDQQKDYAVMFYLASMRINPLKKNIMTRLAILRGEYEKYIPKKYKFVTSNH